MKTKRKILTCASLVLLAILVVSTIFMTLSNRSIKVDAQQHITRGHWYQLDSGQDPIQRRILETGVLRSPGRDFFLNDFQRREIIDHHRSQLQNLDPSTMNISQSHLISSVIPEYLFQTGQTGPNSWTERTEYFYIGTSFGFFIETFHQPQRLHSPVPAYFYSNVVLFTINNGLSSAGAGHLSSNRNTFGSSVNFEIDVIVSGSFLRVTHGMTAFLHPLFSAGTPPYEIFNWPRDRVSIVPFNRHFRRIGTSTVAGNNMRGRMGLRNINYSLNISNVDALNFGDSGFCPNDDEGLFISQFEIESNNSNFQDVLRNANNVWHNNWQLAAETAFNVVSFAVGFIPVVGDALNTVVDILGDVVGGTVIENMRFNSENRNAFLFNGVMVDRNSGVHNYTRHYQAYMNQRTVGIHSTTKSVNGQIRCNVILAQGDYARFNARTRGVDQGINIRQQFIYGLGLEVVEYEINNNGTIRSINTLVSGERVFSATRGRQRSHRVESFVPQDFHLIQEFSINRDNANLYVNLTPQRTGIHYFNITNNDERELDIFKLNSNEQSTRLTMVSGRPFWHEVGENIALNDGGRVFLTEGNQYVFKIRYRYRRHYGAFRLTIKHEEGLRLGENIDLQLRSNEKRRFYFDLSENAFIDFKWEIR
ncbi:MAG: hypothetical protein FWC11_06060, partial [Firmicutes bacterium]|nr:hypothetical protein [Bacillota bacterium]